MGLKEDYGVYKAMNGYYVVNSLDSWVYDVDIYIEGENEKIAVVGFTPSQLDGALFWQASYADILYGNYSSESILEAARKYRDGNRPRALCE
jgi:hypothetical protein